LPGHAGTRAAIRLAPLTFGEFQNVMDPRTMQMALRYEF